jgi:multiple sugar transport system substrate-binding protein
MRRGQHAAPHETPDTEREGPMRTISRRTLLRNAGVLGTWLVASNSLRNAAHADKPITFSGWVFKPDTVKDYVNFYNQKFGGQVKYEPLPWVQYHPTMETRALAGDVVDVMYCVHNNRQRWYENGLIRAMDDLPGVDELKKKMTPANLDSLKSKDGTKLLGLPYFTSLFTLMYNEPMLQQAGISAPARSWDELVEHCTKLKKDRISDTPYLPNWSHGPSETMPQFMSDCFSEGAQVFDANNRVIVDQEPGAARVIERWQKMYKAGMVNPEVLTKTSSTDVHRLFWSGRYAYHTNHSYYLKTIAAEPQNSKLAPKKAKMAMYPGTGATYMWTDSYVLNARTKALEDAWKLTRFLGGNLNGDWYVQRQWCLIAGLDNPYPEMYEHPDIVQSYDRWVDLKLLRRQSANGKVIAAYKEPWYAEYDTKALAIVHDTIRGGATVPKGLKQLASLQKSLA